MNFSTFSDVDRLIDGMHFVSFSRHNTLCSKQVDDGRPIGQIVYLRDWRKLILRHFSENLAKHYTASIIATCKRVSREERICYVSLWDSTGTSNVVIGLVLNDSVSMLGHGFWYDFPPIWELIPYNFKIDWYC